MTSESTFKKVYKIPQENLWLLQSRLEKMAKRAKKLGFPPITHAILGSEPKTIKQSQRSYNTVIHTVEVTGVQPILSGWTFRGKVERLENGGTLVKTITDDVPKKYWDCEPNCDHCQTKRSRRKIFILKNLESGEFKQIGGLCLKDFLNHDDPQAVAGYSETILEMDDYFAELDQDEFNPGDRTPIYVTLNQVLVLAATAIRQDGFISAERGEEMHVMSTGQLVFYNLLGDPKKDAVIKSAPCDEEKAKEVEAWLLSESFDRFANESTYGHNLRALATLGVVPSNQIALVASSVMAYERETAKAKRSRTGVVSQYIGVKDQKLGDLEVTLKFKTTIPGEQWGDKTLYIFEDSQGNDLAWFNGGRLLDVPNDVALHLSGTIKEHREYRGVKQTLLTRVKINENELYQHLRHNSSQVYSDNKAAQKLMKRPLNVNLRFGDLDMTLLDMAVLYNSSYLKPLLAKGANPCLQDANGDTPAHRAVTSDNEEVIGLFKELAPESLHVPNKKGQSAWGLMQDEESMSPS